MHQPDEYEQGGTSPEIKPGSMVVHDGGDDTILGSVEQVVTDPDTRALREIYVRPGRADYLLRIPAEFLDVEHPDRVRVRSDARLEDLERLAIESGRTPPTGTHIQEVARTAPSPQPEKVVGNTPGMPPSWDGPSTG